MTEITERATMTGGDWEAVDDHGYYKVRSLGDVGICFIYQKAGPGDERPNMPDAETAWANTLGVAALPKLVRAAQIGLDYAPLFARDRIEKALIAAGIMEDMDHYDDSMTCSVPDCEVRDNTVRPCEWCEKPVCLEHDDVLSNRGIDSDLMLCQPCGDKYDWQAMKEVLTEAYEAFRWSLKDSPIVEKMKATLEAVNGGFATEKDFLEAVEEYE